MATTNLANLNRYRAPIAPRLPVAPAEYNQQYIDQLTGILRQYFNQLDGLNTTLVGDDSTAVSGISSTGVVNTIGPGGRFIRMPYGAFSSSQTQTTTSNTAKQITLNTTDFSNTVTISSSNITPKYAGIYNFQFSVQIESISTATEDVYIWLKQYTAATATLADIAGSTGLVGMLPRKSARNPSHDIKGWNYFLSMAAGDYLQIYWSTTNGTDVTIPFYAASASPTKPSTQSVVATMQFVSAPIA